MRNAILFLLAILSTVSVHLANRACLKEIAPERLHQGLSVATADDASYLSPAKNHIEIGIWKDNDVGSRAYILRSPGYGMVYAFLLNFFGERRALIALLGWQFFLWAMAVAFIPFIAQKLGISQIIGYILALVIALFPMFSGFLSYTLTEAVTPSLVIFFYASLFYPWKTNYLTVLIPAMILGFCILVRPPMLILLLGLIPLAKTDLRRVLSIALLGVLPFMVWQGRVYRFSGKVDLHPIYQNDTPGLYRPLHQVVWDFHKMTGQSGADFHRSVKILEDAAVNGTDKQVAAKCITEKMDPRVFSALEEKRLLKAYESYISVLEIQVPYQERNRTINAPIPGESDLIEEFKEFRTEYVRKNAFHAWFVSPLAVLKKAIFHSNLSHYIFQSPLRGNFLVEFLRYLSFAIHSWAFATVFLFPFYRVSNRRVLSMAIPVLTYLIYLAFVQRGIEERYTLPFLVPAVMVSTRLWIGWLREISQRYFGQAERNSPPLEHE